MKSILCWVLLTGIGLAAEDPGPTKLALPAIVTGFKEIRYTETHGDLKKLSPTLGEPREAPGEDCTEATESFKILGTEFAGEYDLQHGTLYGWGFHAMDLEDRTAIVLFDRMLPEFERRFGPSKRQLSLPSESDGPRDEVSNQCEWQVGDQSLFLRLDHQPRGCHIAFGSQETRGGSSGSMIRVIEAAEVLKVELIDREGAKYQRELSTKGDKLNLFVLRALHERGVSGNFTGDSARLPDYGQRITAFHEISKPLPGVMVLGAFQLRFPITVNRKLPNGSIIKEIHYSMASLFPEGLRFEGAEVDLKLFQDKFHHVPEP